MRDPKCFGEYNISIIDRMQVNLVYLGLTYH